MQRRDLHTLGKRLRKRRWACGRTFAALALATMAYLPPDVVTSLRAEDPATETITDRVTVARDGRGFVVGDETWSPVGANYFDPLTGWAPKLWQQFDEKRVEEHFRAMAALGVNTARVFLTAASFIPDPPAVDGRALAKLDKMLAIARRHGIRLHPTGPDHWEGTPPWRRTDFLADPKALEVQVTFWHAVARRYRADPAVFAFDLLNEPHVKWRSPAVDRRWPEWLRQRYGTVEKLREAWNDPGVKFAEAKAPPDEGAPGSRVLADYQRFRESIAEEWTRRQVEAIHAEDPKRLVTVGLIQWSAPVLRQRPSGYSAFRPEAIARLVDFSSVHFYPLWGDPIASDALLERNLAYLELLLRICSSPGPLVIGEFGWYGGGAPPRHVERSPEDQARWNRALVERSHGLACGWLNWSWADVPSSRDISKYSGLVLPDGTPKPWGKAFAELAPELARGRLDEGAGERNRVPFPFDEAIVDPAAGTRALERFAAELRERKGDPAKSK